MDQVLEATAYIHEGFWRDLSKSTTRSLTLTLCPTRATLLTNALALFVAMSGGQLWTIIRFSLHQIRAKSRPDTMDKTYNQQQVVLRNATTDIATARLMLYLAWASRRNAKRAMLTCATILVLAVLNAFFFMAAGTFSNTLVDAGSFVLSRSKYCGFWDQSYLNVASYANNPTTNETFALSTEYLAYQTSDVQTNLEYTQACYLEQPSWYWDSSCDTFVRSRLNYVKEFVDRCPFDSNVCSHEVETMTFDTGLIDTHYDLGINAASKDRLQYRRVTQCTVLNDTTFTTGFVAQNSSTGPETPWQVAYANYGPHFSPTRDYTYSYSNFAQFYTNFTSISTIPYQIGTAFGYGAIDDPSLASSGTFEPIKELSVEDADVFLLFLSFVGKFTAPIEDPWFSAHATFEQPDAPFETLQTLYAPDRPISTMGCTEQHQICTDKSHCTSLLGYDQVGVDVTAKLHLTPNQNVTLYRLLRSATSSSMWNTVQYLAITSSPLLATNRTASGSYTVSLPLPEDQWQIELDRWHSVAMARLQNTMVEYGTGQIAPQPKYLDPPVTLSEKWICQNLRIRSSTYQSFDVVSLVVIIVFGTLIIIVSLRIESFSWWIQQRWNKGVHGRDTWNDHDMLGRQRWRSKFDTPRPSLHVSSPSMHMQSPHRNMELAYLQTNFPTFSPHTPISQSHRRASSQALSPGDSGCTFPNGSGRPSPPRTSPSPVRSAFTADFVFDFGPERKSPSPPCTGYPVENAMGEKPLPHVPQEERAFVIHRGVETSSGTDIADEKRIDEMEQGTIPQVEEVVGSGPGRWAYYSAHKRRYGPRLAVPAPHVRSSNLGGLHGSFGSGRVGNWI